MSLTATGGKVRSGWLTRINGAGHYRALTIYLLVVLAHWIEHFVQAVQIYVFDVPRPQARGVLGEPFPFLISSELLHVLYAIYMLVGLALLRRAFSGEARTWWTAALIIQAWHFFEHALLTAQAWSGSNLAGRPVPTSILQLAIARVETHLIYNIIVLIPLLTAISLHWFRRDGRNAGTPPCTCATHFVAS
ncbi:hypothetical protein ACTWLT_14615 [Micromonospora sp. ZYX-F-536]|uniref:hypothetical protein n=1 Tax=Micromonospora sp. ZYX-F-536 TaxID=3457629 RepID=UPI0040407CF3